MKWGALFPGQGSQAVGMGKFLYDEFQTARHVFEEAGDVLKQDMRKLCFEGPDSDLQVTENTQPALVLVSTVTSRIVLETLGLRVEAAAGHSVGEYSALVQAEVLTFQDALLAVRARGRAMQKAVPIGQGGMCAVLGLSDENVKTLCQEVESASGFPIEPANFNSPGQVVVSGSSKAIEWMRQNVKQDWLIEKLGLEAGKPKFIPLAVSAPFHCRLMKPAEEEMKVVLGKMNFSAPRFSVIQNISASSSEFPDEICNNLVGQISGPVLWTSCQNALLARGISKFVELGGGRVLAGLAKKIAGDRAQVYGMNSIADLKALEAAAKS